MNSNTYTQIAKTPILITLAIINLFFIFVNFSNILNINQLILFVVILVLTMMNFYKLSITVTDEKIDLRFGIGIIKKTIPMESVLNVHVVKNSWLMGWGIRLLLNGWMWNADGLQAVELTFKNKKSVFRIGCKNSSELESDIKNRLTQIAA